MSPVLASRSIPISLRAQRLVESPPTAEYIREHLARSEQAYDPIQRPDGYIPLCIAENRLVWDVVLAKMAACRDVPARVLGYDAMTGAMPFRERLAAFLERTFMKRPVQPEQIAVLRCGVLVSENEAVMAAIEAQAYWAACSGDTQFMLGEMIADETWVDRYVATMRSRLAHAYDVVTSALSEAGIPYLPADAGFFLLCDLRRFLTSPTWEGEGLLWRQILERANVNLTPGEACRTAEPGFMRLCFAGLAPEIAALAVRRVAAVLPANP